MDRSEIANAPLILIVEDEVLVAMEMEMLVRAFGYSVLGPAPSVEAANELLDECEPHAALLDVNLRGDTVGAIARRLHAGNVPYALVTGYARHTLEDPALADVPRLSKPVNEAELGQMLRRLLDGG
ncbi:MAG: response regulator [Dehalococcoidia bacterium]